MNGQAFLLSVRFATQLRYEEDIPAFNPTVLRLMKLALTMGFVAHLNACIWYYTGMKATDGTSNWVANCIEDDDLLIEERPTYCVWSSLEGSQYLASIYWAFTTMTTVGYGDIGPTLTSKSEMAVAIVSQVVGTTVFAYVIGNVCNLVLNLDPGERHRKSQVNICLHTCTCPHVNNLPSIYLCLHAYAYEQAHLTHTRARPTTHQVEYLNNYMRDIHLDKARRIEFRRHFNFRLRFKSVFAEVIMTQSTFSRLSKPSRSTFCTSPNSELYFQAQYPLSAISH